MKEQSRVLGLDVLSKAPWGTHLCHFYETKEDLIDTLVSYFEAGLENNELCMWVTAEPLGVEDAKASLRAAVKNLDDYIEKDQIEILDYNQWYTRSGQFDADEVLQGWVEKLNQALERGFDGFRFSGNTFWLEKKDWNNFAAYEAAVDKVIGKYRMLAICSYCLDKCGSHELMDAVRNHEFAIIRQHGKWQIFESTGRKRIEEALRDSEEELRIRNKISEVFLTTPDEQMYAEVLRVILEALNSDYGTFGYFREDGAFVVPAMTREIYWERCNVPEKDIIFERGTFGGIWGRALTERKILCSNKGPFNVPEGHIPIKNTMATPIIYKDEIISAIHIANKATDYDEKDRTLLKTIAEHIAPVLNARLQRDRQDKERKLAQERLRKSEEMFRLAFENAVDAIMWADPDTGLVTNCNKAAETLLEKTRDEIIGEHQTKVHPPQQAEYYRQMFKKHTESKEVFSDEAEVVSKSGKIIPVHITASVTLVGGKPIIQGIFRDITERKRVEKQIEASLREKEILLREIHHRVKNNMQVISSLLGLQFANIKEKQYADMLKESQDRIRSMSLIHDKLYRSKDLANIDFKDYIEGLISGLLTSHGVRTEKIRVTMETGDVSLGLDRAIPCGLIINELVSNSLKYAFPQDRKGEIKIAARFINEDQIELTVNDDGIGLPENLDFRDMKSLGLDLVRILVEDQLEGSLEIDRTRGTGYRIRFRRTGGKAKI